jgi:uncharacterized protein (TIGR00255 family)
MEVVLDSFEAFVGVNLFTMLFAWANLAILYFFLKKLLFKPVKKMIDDRQKEIDDLYSDAEAKTADASKMKVEYEEKLRGKLGTLIEEGTVDEGRIAAEIILTADKLCTDEELVRLESHIKHMRETLDAAGEVGKKLDFLAQEMNRESNTILSKTNDTLTADHAIALKTIIEKIREQIQNIE